MEIPTGKGRRERARRADSEEWEDDDYFVSKRVQPKIGVSPASTADEQKHALLWALLASYLPDDVKSIQKYFVHHVEYTLARGRGNLTNFEAFKAVAYSVRDRLVERWKDTQIYFKDKQCKRVAYLSLEFLVGRSLQNAIVNLGLEDNYGGALRNLGLKLEEMYEEENDAGLGNGGLGRLAACFLDSLATMDYPAWGYGIRYKYGMFYQRIKDGCQVEFPDYWLMHGNPWEIERQDIVHPVNFYGTLKELDDGNGKKKVIWEPGMEVLAVAYDTPIPGYETYNTLNIRLWSAQPSKEFDFELFSKGDFFKSIEEKQNSEQITAVLYPNDNTISGKELRVKQQYFLVCATLQDLIRRLKEMNKPLTDFPNFIAIQLNDTHPALSIVELMRILMDVERLSWKEAWDIVVRTFAYTNHTVMPEALEKWPVDMIERLLPRHMRIIYDINFFFLEEIEKKWPGDVQKLQRVSVIEEGPNRFVRMANLAIIGSHAVNGVAEIHSNILKNEVFPEFYELWPHKFFNMTNGVTPRRWLHQSNPELSTVISAWLRTTNWISNLDLLSGLRPFATNPDLHKQWTIVKLSNKQRLADYVRRVIGTGVNVNSLFDVQVKRIHEYKRQLLNILYVIHRYKVIKAMNPEERLNVVPRTIFFGGKAAPGYYMAKLIIKLINDVAKVINNDPDTDDLLKVVFIPNYCVSLAEIIIPASDLSQHISTAGMEASGTSNMKFSMNGCLIIGTLDGANIEIRKEIGEEHVFIFGAEAHQVADLRKRVREKTIQVDPRFTAVLAAIENGEFGDAATFQPILDALRNGNDYYLLSVDFPSYIAAQDQVDKTYRNYNLWIAKSILSTAGCGKFSSDRTIREYAEKIWDIKPVRRPGPVPVSIERLERTLHVNTGYVSPPEFGASPPSSNFVSLERMTPKFT